MLSIDQVREEADKFFKEVLGKSETSENLMLSPFTISVEDDGSPIRIPVVAEWTAASNDILVFNQLSSCLGLIAVNQEGTRLVGAHFSLSDKLIEIKYADKTEEEINALKEELKAVLTTYITAIRAAGYVNVTSFGGNTGEWDQDANGALTEAEVVPITNDQNEKNWYFAINHEGMVVNYWPE